MDAEAVRLQCQPHPLLGPFSKRVYNRSADFCRVGVIANFFHIAVSRLRLSGIADDAWGDPG
eukprot:8639675-Heterocapsa_arctica.AAC.1